MFELLIAEDDVPRCAGANTDQRISYIGLNRGTKKSVLLTDLTNIATAHEMRHCYRVEVRDPQCGSRAMVPAAALGFRRRLQLRSGEQLAFKENPGKMCLDLWGRPGQGPFGCSNAASRGQVVRATLVHQADFQRNEAGKKLTLWDPHE